MVKNPQETRVGKIPWRMEQLSTLAVWPGEFHGQKSLTGYSPWGCRQSDMTERLKKKILGTEGRLKIQKSINVSYHINRIKIKKHNINWQKKKEAFLQLHINL